MRIVVGALLLGGVLASAVQAQAPYPAYCSQGNPILGKEAAPKGPAGLGQMEIYNGRFRTVRYTATDLNTGDRAILRELERAENEAAYANDLLELRREYVASELSLEPFRRHVQRQLYGLTIENSSSTAAFGNYGGYGGYVYPWSYGYGNGFGGLASSASTTVVASLANGMGDEGRMKSAIANTIAAQATPEFAAGAARAVDTAMATAAQSERLSKAFGLKRAEAAPSRVNISVRNGDKVDRVEGELLGEDSDWLKVDTGKSVVMLRKANVTTIEQLKK